MRAMPMVPAPPNMHVRKANTACRALEEVSYYEGPCLTDLTSIYRALEKLQCQVDQYNSIFSRMFPGQDLETLMSLPREELINLAVTLPAPNTSPSSNSEPTPAVAFERDVKKSDGAESLEALEQAPEQDPEIDEAKRHKDKINAISDDVNGLSLSVDKGSSYVGASSISAVLKVIFKTTPLARPLIAQSYIETAVPSRSNSPPPSFRDVDPAYLPPADIGHKLIESYFSHVHVLMPMIDEDQFWHTYLYGERKDSPWLALLNMVMAFGSLGQSTCDNEDHTAYFQRARHHMDFESFGSGNLLILQALGLFSGYYLHWLNRPNEANCLMGATLRMATALGLHREYNENQPPGSSGSMGRASGHEVPAEIRRRTWWSLVCLDAWGSTTTGRPSLGRMGPGITVESPKIPQQMNNAQYLASLRLLPIIHNIEFCKLATRIQDTLAARSLLKFDELFALDAELVKWHDELPPILRDLIERPPLKKRRSSSHRHGLKSSTPSASTASTASMQNPFDFSQPPDRDRMACPDVLKTPRAIMHWRYQNLRMLMHRPFLLAVALRRTPYASMSAEEKVAVGRCRIIAGQTIADIDQTCQEELIAGWNAVWLMYQASMVPLVSLFSYLSSPAAYANERSPGHTNESSPDGAYASIGNDGDAEKWRRQIEVALQFFEKMRRYSVAAKKSKDVVERLYEASKHVSQYHMDLYRRQKEASQHRPGRMSPVQPLDGSNDASISSLGPFDFTNGDVGQQEQFGQFSWGFSPGGNEAMNNFWDDMMWETFPDVPEAPGWVPGLEQFEWMPEGQQPGSNVTGQDWSQWPLNEHQP